MDDSHAGGAGEVRTSQVELLEFYDHEVMGLYAFIARRCGDAQLAEDLTQEVFVLATRQFVALGAAPTPGWLYRVARNKVIDHWRRESRRERKFRLIAGGRAAQPVADPADRLVSTHRVDQALKEIPVDQRAALILRYLDDYSIAEIATALGRSAKATESLLARGRKGFERNYEAETDG